MNPPLQEVGVSLSKSATEKTLTESKYKMQNIHRPQEWKDQIRFVRKKKYIQKKPKTFLNSLFCITYTKTDLYQSYREKNTIYKTQWKWCDARACPLPVDKDPNYRKQPRTVAETVTLSWCYWAAFHLLKTKWKTARSTNKRFVSFGSRLQSMSMIYLSSFISASV